MFYNSEPDFSVIRFGDIIKGIPLNSYEYNDNSPTSYYTKVEIPDFCVVLTPCCSIRDKIITVTPLIQIKPTFILNRFIAEDLLRINKLYNASEYYLPEDWEKLNPEEQLKIKEEKASYFSTDLFIYDKNSDLKEYSVKAYNKTTKETKEALIKQYMIDFKNTYNLNVKKDTLNKIKLYELSKETRTSLYTKLGCFYRSPAEDN